MPADNDLLINEAAMFRVFLLVGLAAAPVIALGLLVSPLAAAILLGFELGVGIGLLVRRLRGSTASRRSRR